MRKGLHTIYICLKNLFLWLMKCFFWILQSDVNLQFYPLGLLPTATSRLLTIVFSLHTHVSCPQLVSLHWSEGTVLLCVTVKDGSNEPRSCSFTATPLSAKCSELHYSTVSKMKSDKVKYFFHHILPGCFLKGWIIHPFKSSTAKDEGALTSSQVYWFLEHSLHMMGASNGDSTTEAETWEAQIRKKSLFYSTYLCVSVKGRNVKMKLKKYKKKRA